MSVRKAIRTLLPYAPGLVALLAMAVLPEMSFAQAATVTQKSCTFGNTWGPDGIARVVFGISTVLMILAALLGGMQVRAGSSGGGGEVVGGAIGGISGIAIMLGLLGMAGALASVAATAAGQTPCPA